MISNAAMKSAAQTVGLMLLVMLACTGCPNAKKAGEPKQKSLHARPSDPWKNDPAAVRPTAPDDISPVSVMFINGETVTAEEILRPVRKELEERAAVMPLEPYQRYLVDAVGSRIRAEARERLLYQAASKDITEQEWEQFDKFVDTRVRETINEQHQGRQTRYEKSLADKGVSLEQDRQRLRRELVIQRYLYQNVGRRITNPTRRELWQYYQDHLDEMTRPARREMFLIEVPKDAPLEAVTAANGEKVQLDAKTAITMARSELIAGTEFAEVAQKYSAGLHAAEGGPWGMVARDSVRERWQPAVDALFQLESGQVSDTIETDEAYFIVRCGKIDSGEPPDFETIQPQLVERYREAMFNRLVEELVADLHSRAVIQPANLGRFLRGVVESAPMPSPLPPMP
ncbi:MAG: peptidyl-prolyl cis-trans isomerase [Phycisphaerae bacterium]|nr:peptidyl-prolyl cis-trans isomerase [Phycisphaerae bacterium]